MTLCYYGRVFFFIIFVIYDKIKNKKLRNISWINWDFIENMWN